MTQTSHSIRVVTGGGEASYELTDAQFTQYNTATIASIYLSYTDNGVTYNTTSFTLKSPQKISRSTALSTGVLAALIAGFAALLLTLCFCCCGRKGKKAEEQMEEETSDALMTLMEESQKKEGADDPT